MYDDEALRIPIDEDDFWELLDWHFGHVEYVLTEIPVETRTDAETGGLRARYGTQPNKPMTVIKYLNVPEDYEQRDRFLKLGRKLVPEVRRHLDRMELTPEFAHKRGQIMFCHGYIAAHYFCTSDDFSHARKGRLGGKAREKRLERKWLAHQILNAMNNGLKRDDAEHAAAQRIKEIVLNRPFSRRFPREWYLGMLQNRGYFRRGYITASPQLKATYDQKHFSKKQMQELRDLPMNDIPPL